MAEAGPPDQLTDGPAHPADHDAGSDDARERRCELRAVDPVIPLVAADLAVSTATAALLSTAFALPYALTQPILGPVADMVGKTRFMTGCLVVLTAACLVGAVAPTFAVVLAARVLSGIVAGFIVNIDRASRESQDLELVLVNYFSMFTIVSALLSVIALVAAATWAQRHPGTTRRPGAIRSRAPHVQWPTNDVNCFLIFLLIEAQMRLNFVAWPFAQSSSSCWSPLSSAFPSRRPRICRARCE